MPSCVLTAPHTTASRFSRAPHHEQAVPSHARWQCVVGTVAASILLRLANAAWHQGPESSHVKRASTMFLSLPCICVSRVSGACGPWHVVQQASRQGSRSAVGAPTVRESAPRSGADVLTCIATQTHKRLVQTARAPGVRDLNRALLVCAMRSRALLDSCPGNPLIICTPPSCHGIGRSSPSTHRVAEALPRCINQPGQFR